MPHTEFSHQEVTGAWASAMETWKLDGAGIRMGEQMTGIRGSQSEQALQKSSEAIRFFFFLSVL